MTLVLIIKDLVLLGPNPQNKGQMAYKWLPGLLSILIYGYYVVTSQLEAFVHQNQQQLRRLKETLLEGCVIPNHLCLISRF